MKPNIGLSQQKLNHINELLSVVLATAMALYIKTRKFHWNVEGESFMELHQLFEKHYKQLEKAIDEIAERIGKLGGKAEGTMQEYLQKSLIKESPGKYPAKADMIKELLKDHESVITALRKAIDDCDEKFNDAGTADFLTDLIKEHETIAWTLRRYIK
ncbi:MAG: DNA starvation/stationary phase protection protein [Bacteroidetes bacterium]|nr:DNA starvation/stationary phase protection protein [Bacteroidota bacterium]